MVEVPPDKKVPWGPPFKTHGALGGEPKQRVLCRSIPKAAGTLPTLSYSHRVDPGVA